MKQNYVITDPNEILKFLQRCQENHPDRVFVTGVTTGGSVSAPTKRKANYSHKLEHVFSPDLFTTNGVEALIDGGGFYIAHISTKHIKPDLMPKEKKSDLLVEEKIKEAKRLLDQNDYAVIKLSKQQIKDYTDCGACADAGKEKDCSEWSCSACVVE